MLRFILSILLFIGFESFAQNIESSLICLAKLNRVRREAGLDTVTLSSKLSKGCNNHAKYLILNKYNEKTAGLMAHKEFKELSGYTPEGESAGTFSVIHFMKPIQAIDDWVNTFYHRIPLLQPNLKEIGIGYSTDGVYEVCLLQCISNKNNTKIKVAVVYYPAPGQKNVPIKMTEELPNPIPDSLRKQPTCGFPITIYFANYQVVKNVIFKLTDYSGTDVGIFLSTPEKPATYFDQWHSVCAIPKERLKNNRKYTVSFQCTMNGTPLNSSYSFTTIPEE